MFIDNVVEVAKKELAWEVDYRREAECTKKFKQLLSSYNEYFVPAVIGTFLFILVVRRLRHCITKTLDISFSHLIHYYNSLLDIIGVHSTIRTTPL